MSDEENRSELSKAIAERPDPVTIIEVGGFFGLGNKPIHKIAFRICNKGEENDAVIKSHKWLLERAGELKAITEDDDIMLDLKNVHIMFAACRRAEEGDEEQGYMYPAFPGPQWMMDNITTDQLAALLNVYNDVRHKSQPGYYELTYDKMQTMMNICANTNDDVMAMVMAEVSREWLAEAFIVLSKRYKNEDRYQSGGAEEGGPVSDSSEDKEAAEDDAEDSGEAHSE
jgi:hypothetical protein